MQQHSLRINEVVEDVLKLIHGDLINQHVTVDVELGRNLPFVTGDPVQLQQVLLNLVVNACDAMTNCDTPTRWVLIRTGIESGSAVIVSVTDQGRRIPRGKYEQIFEPFFTTKEDGMGLGLSGAPDHHYRASRKTLGPETTDRGATFHFSLPIGTSDGHR